MILANPIGNPYKGPIPYSETDLDSERFFGRTNLQKLVKLNLQNSPLTVFYGVSGVGKSSLLRAGVASVLRREAERNLQNGNPKFGIVVFRDWFDNPLEKLKCQIKKDIQQINGIKCIDPSIEGEGWENSEEKKTLKILAPDLKFPFVEYLRVWTKCLGGDNCGELYIILDQFEDYFSCQEDQHSRETFVNGFTRVIEDYDYSEMPVRFLVSIREDLLAKADRFFKGRISRWFDNRISLDQLTASEAIEAIEKPITEWYNKKVSSEQQFEIEDKFSESIVEKIANDNDGKTIEAAYLQLVMRKLWEKEQEEPGSHKLRIATLDELDGTKGIIEQHLKTRLKLLDTENDRRTVASIFRHLVTPSGTSISHNASDLFEYTNDNQFLPHRKLDKDQFQKLLGTLNEDDPSRILRPIGGTRYEILFSAYAKVILNWLNDYKKEQEKFKLSRISTIAQRAITLAKESYALSQEDGHIQEHDGANDELSALLALRAYFWNEESSLPMLSRVDQALREALRIPYFSTLLEGHQREVVAVAFSADGQQLIAADIEDKILHWNLRQFDSSPKDPGSEKKQPIILSVAIQNGDLKIDSYNNFLPDSGDDVKLGAEHQTLLSKSLEICTSASDPDQDTVAVELRGLKIYLFEVTIQIVNSRTDETAQLDIDQDRNDYAVSAIAFSQDNRILVAGYRDGIIQWQDLETGITLRNAHNQSAISAIAVSSDRKLLAIGSEDATIQLWQVESDRLSLTAILRGHQKKINCLAFNCNNSFLASGSEDTTVRLWEVKNDRTDYL
ncbi:WD40 repeat domain-containing protein [Pseudanabaena sp. PCC 6802]|uniref:WD40 repeat domain-containing protein n=1 Tax=Pseudanabaena sp. PCC 6802 TaxID=118173 RepID=UPI00034883F8|nr:hypothetical protein [Pseudanabaena sp. PCC 6802]